MAGRIRPGRVSHPGDTRFGGFPQPAAVAKPFRHAQGPEPVEGELATLPFLDTL